MEPVVRGNRKSLNLGIWGDFSFSWPEILCGRLFFKLVFAGLKAKFPIFKSCEDYLSIVTRRL